MTLVTCYLLYKVLHDEKNVSRTLAGKRSGVYVMYDVYIYVYIRVGDFCNK